MLIKHVSTTLVDVFVGLGWKNWSRFEKTDKGPKLVKGFPVTKEQYKEIKHVFHTTSAT